MNKGKYEKIREKYPDYISKGQLYKICSMSPRSATYLLEQGIITAIDTGKKTWRYKIALEDVIDYLRKREKRGSMIPRGATGSKKNPRVCYASIVPPGKENEVREYFVHIYSEYSDVLNTREIAEMTGFSRRVVTDIIKKGEIKSIHLHGNIYLVPKKILLQFVSTPRFINAKSNSETFKKILEGFQLWITAKS